MKFKFAITFWFVLLCSFWLRSDALALVTTRGFATSTGEDIIVQVYADISDVSILSFTCRLLYDPQQLKLSSAQRNDAVWALSDGKVSYPYLAPDTSRTGEVYFIGGFLDLRRPTAGIIGPEVLLGTVTFKRLTQDAPPFRITIGQEGKFANFVTTQGQVLEAKEGQVVFGDVSRPRDDQDLDTLLDDWEVKHFGSIEKSFYLDDSDRDGINNLGESQLGSDPVDPKSNLSLVIAPAKPGELSLQWVSAENRTYSIESSDDLVVFKPFETGIIATPPNNSHAILIGLLNPRFYRVVLETSP